LLRRYFCVVDIERVSHGVLADEVEHLHSFDEVLFVDEKIELLPLFSHYVKAGAFKYEVAHRLQDPYMDSQSIDCTCFSFAAVE